MLKYMKRQQMNMTIRRTQRIGTDILGEKDLYIVSKRLVGFSILINKD